MDCKKTVILEGKEYVVETELADAIERLQRELEKWRSCGQNVNTSEKQSGLLPLGLRVA